MTQEEKAKLYDEVVNKLKDFMVQGVDPLITRADVQDFFPELRESEGERIRKELIGFIKGQEKISSLETPVYQSWLAWLEKQGEQKPTDCSYAPSREMVLNVWELGNLWKELTSGSMSTEHGTQLDYVIKHWNEGAYYKKIEQKPFNYENANIQQKDFAPKVEPKFHEGNWIIKKRNSDINKFGKYKITDIKDGKYWYNEFIICEISDQDEWESVMIEHKFHKGEWIACKGLATALIVNINDDKYEVEFIDGNKAFPHIDYVDRLFHLWTIQDAKDGDVLICKGELKYSNGIKYERICLFNNLDNAFFTLTKTSNFVEEYDIDVNIDYPDNTVPATKEQKEILFMAMKDAGYEFDFEKKELKKIEQKTWSEEDENALGDALWCCKQAASIAKDENDMGNAWYAERWLKSLKDRVLPQTKQEWKQENTGDLTDFENAMMHIGISFFGENAGLDPNDTNVIKEQANLLSELVPKQEWSEEDEMIALSIEQVMNCASLLNIVPEKIDKIRTWLKSLKDRVQLISAWKPTDEQMKALDDVISSRGIKYDILSELWKDLNKLREE